MKETRLLRSSLLWLHRKNARIRFIFQFNDVFALLISMPHFKSIKFYQRRPKLKLFFKKIQNFRALEGLNTPSPPNCRFPAMRLNLIKFLLIFVPPEFSLMPCFKSINFYQNKPKIKLVLQKNKIFWVLGASSPDLKWPPAELPDPQTSFYPIANDRYLK